MNPHPSLSAPSARRGEGAPSEADRAPGGLSGPRRLRLFPPADRERAQGQPSHSPARSRQGARRTAAPCARALRLSPGRSPDEGAFPCRLQARAGRHPGVRALHQTRRGARPLSRPRRAFAPGLGRASRHRSCPAIASRPDPRSGACRGAARVESCRFGTQAVEIAGAPIDFAHCCGADAAVADRVEA